MTTETKTKPTAPGAARAPSVTKEVDMANMLITLLARQMIGLVGETARELTEFFDDDLRQIDWEARIYTALSENLAEQAQFSKSVADLSRKERDAAPGGTGA
jgi:hypothetical protein